MSAPRFFSLAFCAVVAALVAAGCTVPGAGRLDGPPKDLPAILDYVTADSMSFTLLDADPASKRWDAFDRTLGEGDENVVLAAHWRSFLGDEVEPSDAAKWAGRRTGIARFMLDLDHGRDDDAATLWYADVAKRAALDGWLEGHDWTRTKGGIGAGALGDGFTVWTLGGAAAGDADVTAVAVKGDTILGAADKPALRALVKAAERYAVPDRKATADYAASAVKRTPMAVVFRTDILRTQVRRVAEDDPALLELARWATSSKFLLAMRDGWLGIAPPVDASRPAVRLVGNVDWIADLAPDVTLAPVEAKADPSAVLSVSVHDLGQFVADAVNGVANGGNQFATEEDVADEDDRVKLFPLLDDLDGDAVVSWFGGRDVRARIDSDHDGVANRLERALDLIDVDADVAEQDGGVRVVSPSAAKGGVFVESGTTDRAFAPAGKPPRQPISWIAMAGTTCDGPTVGWVTYDRVERFTISLDVQTETGQTSGAPAACGRPNPLDLLLQAAAPVGAWKVDSRLSDTPGLTPEVTSPTPRR